MFPKLIRAGRFDRQPGQKVGLFSHHKLAALYTSTEGNGYLYFSTALSATMDSVSVAEPLKWQRSLYHIDQFFFGLEMPGDIRLMVLGAIGSVICFQVNYFSCPGYHVAVAGFSALGVLFGLLAVGETYTRVLRWRARNYRQNLIADTLDLQTAPLPKVSEREAWVRSNSHLIA